MTDRTIVLLRHAKAEHPVGLADLDRPLTARGHADAVAAGAWLVRSGYRPSAVVCSPAKRTRQTWRAVAVQLDATADRSAPPSDKPAVRYDHGVYEGDPAGLLDLLRAVEPTADTVLLVGHNPGISLLSSLLDPERADRDGLRTTGIAVHRLTGDWTALTPGGAPLVTRHTARG
jgi:phosphohistidine phosphatase